MTDDQGSYLLAITRTARRRPTDHLPEAAAAAAYEFLVGPLLDDPHPSASGSARHSTTGTAPAAAPAGSSTASTTTRPPSPSSTPPRRDARRNRRLTR